MDQAELARRAGLSVTMISNMEGQGDALFRSSFETVQAVQRALEAAGIEFLDGDRPGGSHKGKQGVSHHVARLIPRQSGGKHYYTYSVEFAGELIVQGSNNPEHDACRALLARGFAGTLLILGCATGRERRRIDIERGALWTVSEEQRGFRLRRWEPPINAGVEARTVERSDPSSDASKAA